MAIVTSFSSENLKPVGIELRKRFPQSTILIFGDNERHLQENKGRDAAIAARDAIDVACEVVMPDFSGCPISREFSDWNDYVRENGVRATRKIVENTLKKTKG